MVEQVMSDPMVEKILSPDWAALLVVDVQNDFCHEGGAFGRLGHDLGPIQTSVRALASFIEEARRARVPVIFIKTHHGPSTNSQAWLTRTARRGGELCVPGSWGAEFYQVAPAPDEPVLVKHRYSAFFNTDLDTILRCKGIETLIFAGVGTNACVESTVRDAFCRDYKNIFLSDGTATMDLPDRGWGPISREDAQRYALTLMSSAFAQVMSVDEVLRALAGITA